MNRQPFPRVVGEPEQQNTQSHSNGLNSPCENFNFFHFVNLEYVEFGRRKGETIIREEIGHGFVKRKDIVKKEALPPAPDSDRE